MSISAPFIRRPIATSLLMAGILLVGAAAYRSCRWPRCRRSISRPSRSRRSCRAPDPETMASSVTAPLERQFAQIPGVTQMTSIERARRSSVTVQFDLSRNIDAAAQAISRPRSMPPAASCRRTCRRRPTTKRSIRPIRRSWCSPSTPTRCRMTDGG